MTINITSNEKAAEDPSIDFDSEMTDVIKEGKLTGDEILTSTFGHEIEHTTRKNYIVAQREAANVRGANKEYQPDKVQLKILKEIRNKKKKQ